MYLFLILDEIFLEDKIFIKPIIKLLQEIFKLLKKEKISKFYLLVVKQKKKKKGNFLSKYQKRNQTMLKIVTRLKI